jgi:hypothetical protein
MREERAHRVANVEAAAHTDSGGWGLVTPSRLIPVRSQLVIVVAVCCCLLQVISSDAAVLPAAIDSDMLLTHASSPWELRSDVTITSGVTVTVEPDVQIIATGDWRLTVSGSLIAMSPAGSRIVFRAPDSESIGAWKGLYFTRGSTGRFQRCSFLSATDNILVDGADVRLYNCHLRSASRDGLMAWGDSFIKAAYCRFQNNGRHGVHLQSSAPEGAVIFSEFVGNGEHPVRVKANCLAMLRRGNTYEHNGTQAIGVDCDAAVDITGTACWRDHDLPLDMTVGSTNAELLIDSGAILRIKSGIRIYPPRRIVVRGKLLVDGLPDANVTIQPQGAAQPGDWLGIALEEGAEVRVRAATIGFARDGFTVGNARLYLDGVMIRNCAQNGIFGAGRAHADLARCTISACGANGIALPQATSTGKIHSTRVVECGDYPVRIAATVAEALRTNNSWRDNARQAIGVVCAGQPDLSDDDAWLPQGIPYDLTADPNATVLGIARSGRLSLRPGVEVLGGGITVSGVFVAAGEAGRPVKFDAAEDVPAPGDWTGLEFAPDSAGRLVHATIRHAATGVNIQSEGWIQLVSSEIRDSELDGVRVSQSGKPLITGCNIHHNGRFGVSVWNDAAPLMGAANEPANPGRSRLVANGEYDLANHTTHALLAQQNWWGLTAQAEIGARILDRSEEAWRGPVNFTPFLNAQPAGTTAFAETPVSIMSVTAVPTATGAAIHVMLSRAADIRITLRNIAGRPIREIAVRADATAVVPWDGRDLRGSMAPAGAYIVEVAALGDDGSLSRGLTTLVVRR